MARLERPAGDDDTGLAGAARFATGAPCSRVLDGAVLTRRAPCSRALAGRATGGSSVASVAHGSPKAFTEVGSLEATPGMSTDASIGLASSWISILSSKSLRNARNTCERLRKRR